MHEVENQLHEVENLAIAAGVSPEALKQAEARGGVHSHTQAHAHQKSGLPNKADGDELERMKERLKEAEVPCK